MRRYMKVRGILRDVRREAVYEGTGYIERCA